MDRQVKLDHLQNVYLKIENLLISPRVTHQKAKEVQSSKKMKKNIIAQEKWVEAHLSIKETIPPTVNPIPFLNKKTIVLIRHLPETRKNNLRLKIHSKNKPQLLVVRLQED